VDAEGCITWLSESLPVVFSSLFEPILPPSSLDYPMLQSQWAVGKSSLSGEWSVFQSQGHLGFLWKSSWSFPLLYSIEPIPSYIQWCTSVHGHLEAPRSAWLRLPSTTGAELGLSLLWLYPELALNRSMLLFSSIQWQSCVVVRNQRLGLSAEHHPALEAAAETEAKDRLPLVLLWWGFLQGAGCTTGCF
jgi:hypothetical protein